MTGDFFQLSPVKKRSDDGSRRFFFESKSWNQAIRHTIKLSQMRDPEFAQMLNEIRERRLSRLIFNSLRKFHGTRVMGSRWLGCREAGNAGTSPSPLRMCDEYP